MGQALRDAMNSHQEGQQGQQEEPSFFNLPSKRRRLEAMDIRASETLDNSLQLQPVPAASARTGGDRQLWNQLDSVVAMARAEKRTKMNDTAIFPPFPFQSDITAGLVSQQLKNSETTTSQQPTARQEADAVTSFFGKFDSRRAIGRPGSSTRQLEGPELRNNEFTWMHVPAEALARNNYPGFQSLPRQNLDDSGGIMAAGSLKSTISNREDDGQERSNAKIQATSDKNCNTAPISNLPALLRQDDNMIMPNWTLSDFEPRPLPPTNREQGSDSKTDDTSEAIRRKQVKDEIIRRLLLPKNQDM